MPLAQLVGCVLDFTFPSICATCGAHCAGSSFQCDLCTEKLDALCAGGACDRCAMPLERSGNPCPYCKGRGLTPLESIVRLGIFDEPLKHLIHQLKYHRRWSVGERLVEILASTPRAQRLISADAVLVPVPLHWFRHIKRRYNQAEILARRLQREFGCQMQIAARRVRNTESQTNIHSNADRHDNVRGVFALKRRADLQDKQVILVDDVMTTGATLRSLARTIRQARPASIDAIVLAIADPRKRDFQTI